MKITVKITDNNTPAVNLPVSIKNSNYQYTIDNVVYTSKNTIIYDFDDNFILYDKENKKLIKVVELNEDKTKYIDKRYLLITHLLKLYLRVF